MRKIARIVVIIVIAMIMLVPASWAQSYNKPENLSYWLGVGSIDSSIFYTILKTEMETPFENDSTKVINFDDFTKNCWIFSGIERDSILGLKVLVIFWFKGSFSQEFVVYQYPYQQGYLSNFEEIKENFRLYFDYCENSFGNKGIIENSWINIWVYPKTVFCAQVLTELDLEYLIYNSRFVNLFVRIKDI